MFNLQTILLFTASLLFVGTNWSTAVNITATFTTNVKKVENGKPFLGSCLLANLASHETKSYTVNYYKTSTLSKTLIAIHEISGKF